ncbi:hypothetical protein [uncultured Dialister sp.]|uniref:hypothetical protein n=1 Tax=uncultured Dialister sp. TaxID=278064 RepID=UPI0026140A5D|nr:hypothetical protein [uncultured Dialister sp.]
MDELNFILLAIGFLMTIWSYQAVKGKGPERRYPLWYRGLRVLFMCLILLPCILVTVSGVPDGLLSYFLYAQIAAFGGLLFLDGTKSRFGRKVAGADSGSGRGMIVFLGAAATVLMWAAVLYMMR